MDGVDSASLAEGMGAENNINRGMGAENNTNRAVDSKIVLQSDTVGHVMPAQWRMQERCAT